MDLNINTLSSTEQQSNSQVSTAGDEEEVDVTGDDLYNCPYCSMQFSSKSSLLEHQNKQHLNKKPFKCELCGKTFAVRRYLREHESKVNLKMNLSALFKFLFTVWEFLFTKSFLLFNQKKDLISSINPKKS
uniref:C2H2-type domain-containing protein n=1 Tax=Lates calcarifer TaxID=8187 RepID=A0A4W6CRR0_LATCA